MTFYFLIISGFFEHIEDQRNLREKVLNYILVMARPLIMYQTDHPVYWSPVYLASKVLLLSIKALNKLFYFLLIFSFF
jgi:hypothetical protein